jgi:hypothetical protein
VEEVKASTKRKAEEKLREVEAALKEAVDAAARNRDRVERVSGRRPPTPGSRT